MPGSEQTGPLTVDRWLAARYRLVRMIARGGMAQVWEGRDEVLSRPVALKLLDPDLAHDDSFVERFRREAIAAARLTHPNIVATFDTGTDTDGTTYIVMELVRGQTLRDYLTAEGPLSPTTAVGIAVQTADALAHAHAAGLVHRDIKPGNILLCDTGSGPEAVPAVKVADFGIAKLGVELETGADAESGTGPDLTKTGMLMGTPRYLSPEQIEGREPDRRSDVYGLGVVLFEMLTGRPPFDGPTDIATAVQHVHNAPPLLGQLRPDIPRDLQDVVAATLAKDPAARPQSAAELRGTLSRANLRPQRPYPGVETHPTPSTRIVPAPRPARPHRGPAIALAALILAAAVAAGLLIRSGDHPRSLASSTQLKQGNAAAIPITAASVFHLERDADHAGEARLTVDGNPDTAWTTDIYRGPHFANLRNGLGLSFVLTGSERLGTMHVHSTTQGWSAQVFVAASPATTLAGWGTPVDTKTGIAGDATFNLHGRRGGAVLLWITDLGPTYEASIAEVTLTA